MPDDSLLSEAAPAAEAPVVAQTGTDDSTTKGQPEAPPPAPIVDWKTTIPQDIRGEKLWDKFATQEEVFKSHVQLEKKLGSAVNIPTDKSTTEERDSFYSKLGRPAKADDYKLDLPDLPEGKVWDDKQVSGFKATAHELGLNDTQLNKLMGLHAAAIAADVPDRGKIFADTRDILKKEWGDMLDRNLAFAKREAREHPEFFAELKALGTDNYPEVVKLMAKFGAARAEHSFVDGDRQADVGKADAAKEYQAIMSDTEGPYWNRRHPGHDEAVQRAYYLNQIIHNPV